MRVGRRYLVYLYADDETDRLVASAKINKFLSNDTLTVAEGDKVDLLIGEATELGYHVIINDQHQGLIYHNEVFRHIDLGDRLPGYVKNIRDDHKIDVSLQQQGYANVEPNAQRILQYLHRNRGFMDLTDKSRPEEIMARLEMSKKTFKKALGNLFKNRQVRLTKDGVYLVE